MNNVRAIEEVDFDCELRPQITLNVDWNQKQGELSYSIFNSDQTPECWKKEIPTTIEEIEDFWQQLDKIFYDATKRANPPLEVWNSIRLNLKALGKSLFEQLIPCEVAEKIQQWQSERSVCISTTEQWIPWELMHDHQNFWGRRFIIARTPRLLNNIDAFPASNRFQTKALKPIKRIVNVVGGEVSKKEEIVKKASKLFDGLLSSISIEVLHEITVDELEQVLSIKDTDILHFTCHGLFDSLYLLQIASDKSVGKNICIHTIRELSIEQNSLIFVNACASNTPVRTLGKFKVFGWECYLKGTDICIGTLGKVPIEYAVNFAENFYKYLLNNDVNLTIGEAIAKAKELAEKENNIFWLLYSIYGDPDCYFDSI